MKDLDFNSIPSFCCSINENRYNLHRKIFEYHNIRETVLLPGARYQYLSGVFNGIGAFNCKASHVEMVKYAMMQNYPVVAIFEDDAYPIVGIVDKLNSILRKLPDNADMLIIGWSRNDNPISDEDGGGEFRRVKKICYGSHSYIIFNKFYQKFLDYHYSVDRPADFFHELGANGNVYSTKENLFIQYCTFDSIGKYSGYVVRGDKNGLKNPPDEFVTIEKVLEKEKVNVKNYLIGLKDYNWIYRPNGGNIGDFLLACSEFQLFDSIGFHYERLSKTNSNLVLNSDCNLIMGGGGGFVNYYIGNVRCWANRFFKNKNIKRFVILPNTFYMVDEIVDLFDERFTVFCRDCNSYFYCVGRNKRARFFLSDDSAFQLDTSKIDYKKCPENTNYLKLKQAIQTFNSWYEKNKTLTVAPFLRQDVEKNNFKIPENNFDLSLLFFCDGEEIEKQFAIETSMFFLNSIDKFSIIETNRLHVAIGAHLLGKKIKLHDNSYGKLFSVYENSLVGDDNIEKIVDN